MISGAVLFLFIFGLGVLLWAELGPNGTWRRAQRASDDLAEDARRRRVA